MAKRIAAAAMAAAIFLCILTVSIGLPIYIRPFYYLHIDAMDLPKTTGYTKTEIRQAYDDMLDYLTLPGREFKVGKLAFSDRGRDHFADCKGLFDLNLGVMIGSALCLAVLLALRKKLGPYRLGNHTPLFYGSLAAIVLPIVIGGLASLNFGRAFVIFHSIFFPGKTNWVFHYRADPIILLLPRDFFMHCAILIGAGVLVLSALGLVLDRKLRKKN